MTPQITLDNGKGVKYTGGHGDTSHGKQILQGPNESRNKDECMSYLLALEQSCSRRQ